MACHFLPVLPPQIAGKLPVSYPLSTCLMLVVPALAMNLVALLHNSDLLLYTIPQLLSSSHYLQVPALAMNLVALLHSSDLLLNTIPLLLSSSHYIQVPALAMNLVEDIISQQETQSTKTCHLSVCHS